MKGENNMSKKLKKILATLVALGMLFSAVPVGVADDAAPVDTGIVEDSFRKSSLTGVNVRHDTDITDIIKRNLTVRGFSELFIVAHRSSFEAAVYN